MRQLRISGIVGIANQVRRMLSAPLTVEQRRAVATRVERAVSGIDAILRQHNASTEHLPAPSRRAYEFLKRLDLESFPAAPPAGSGDLHEFNGPPGRDGESVRLPGLRNFLTRILDDVALSLAHGRFNLAASLKVIRNTTDRLNHVIARQKIEPEHLKQEPRQMVGWFRYFSAEPAFAAYVEAVRRAQRVLPSPLSAHSRWRVPFLIHYRPSSLLYRIQSIRDGTRMTFDTPMITFDEGTLRQLAQRMLGRMRNQKEMMAAMLSEAYQQMVADLDAAAGVVERTRGFAHDLADSFDRVNREYFDGRMPRPTLAWNRVPTGRKFGHYDFIHDRVCVSSTLDRPDVPAWVIDHIMHHELLHKKHGFRFQGSRQQAHTPEFREEERRFRQYSEADAFLNQLSARMG